VVSFSGKPIPIDDEVIALLKSRVDDEGFLRLGEPLKPGDKVRIKDGIWKDLVGVVERDLNASERIRLLITTIQYQGSLTVEKDCVEKILTSHVVGPKNRRTRADKSSLRRVSVAPQ
jgi:transcription antitermination factor NusG